MNNLKTFINGVEKSTHDVFNEFGSYHYPTWFLETESGDCEIIATPFEDSPHKDLVVLKMKEYFKIKNVVRYAFVMEAWFATENLKENERVKDLHENIIPPSQRPDRKEAICIAAEEKVSGETMFIVHEIDRSGDKPKLLPNKIDNFNGSVGRFTNMFEQHKTKH
jgi:hypothetical protein